MRINPYSAWQYAVLVAIGELLGLSVAGIFLFNASLTERIPDFAKVSMLAGIFVALFWFAMARRPRRQGN